MPDKIEHLQRLLRERIVILDGPRGTMIQALKLSEADFRGDRFKNHPRDLKGNNDILNLTRPEIVYDIYHQFLEAGSDIIGTNTFNANRISQADYGMESLAYEINVAAAQCARRAVDKVMAAQPGRIRFVAGAIGPTTKTSSISTDVNNPAARGATFDELVKVYGEQVNGLLDGGVDLLLVETIFDTLNARAAFFAIQKIFEERGIEPLQGRAGSPLPAERRARSDAPYQKRIPVMASVTFIQAGSNRGVTDRPSRRFGIRFPTFPCSPSA